MTRISLRIGFCFLLLALATQVFPISQKKTHRKNSAALTEPASPEKSKTEALRAEAFADPFNEDKLRAYMAVLPKDGDLYILEGDILLTEQEVRAYVVAKSQAQSSASDSSELLVNVHNGDRDYYRDVNQRNLTYAVDRNSFPTQAQYKKAVDNMRAAGLAWQNACTTCRLKFSYLTQFDTSPSHNNVNFIVRFKDVGGAYIAAAFFPHDGPVRRYVNIDPSYFNTSFDKVGVLRHELGHVIGYRHEHTRNIPGCYFEDNNWQPLTPYDSQSVMHYFCGGAVSLTLALSPLDRSGHRKLYKLP